MTNGRAIDNRCLLISTAMIGHGVDVERLERVHNLLVQQAGRLNRLNRHGIAVPGNSSGGVVVYLAPGSGKTYSALYIMASLAQRELEAERAMRQSVKDTVANMTLAEDVLRRTEADVSHEAHGHISLACKAPSRRTTDELMGRVIGLARRERRNLRALLLGLVELRGSSLRERRDQLDAKECRARVHSRAPLCGSRTLNAPPTGLFAWVAQGKAGALCCPPMMLAA